MSTSETNSDYDIRISRESDLFPIDSAWLRTLIENILRHFEIPRACVDLAVVADPAMIEMHKQYLGSPETTDVLSFDLTEDRQGRCFQIVVNAQQAARQAARRGHRLQAELALYIVHGLLHNLGYDDAAPEQARHMHRMEDRLLEQNGCGAVYYHAQNNDGKET